MDYSVNLKIFNFGTVPSLGASAQTDWTLLTCGLLNTTAEVSSLANHMRIILMFYNIMCPFIPIDFKIQVARYRFLSLVSDCNVPWSISPPYKTLTCWRFFWLIYYNEVTVNVWRISITFQPWPRRVGRQPGRTPNQVI